MLVSDIQTRVKNIFGDKAQAQIDDPMILDWINDGQKDICRKAECLETIQISSITGGSSSYPYPSDLIKERSVKVSGILLKRLTLSSIDVLFPDRESVTPVVTGSPLYYYSWSRTINLYPTPPSNISNGLNIWYVRNATLLTTTGQTPEIPDIFHEDLVRYCLWRAFEQDQDWAGAGQFKSDYDMRLLSTIYDSNVQQSEAYPSVQLCAGDGG